MHAYASALRACELHSPLALRDMAALLVHFVCRLSPPRIVQSVLLRKMASSLLQRWMRDHLLTFQDAFAAYAARRDKASDKDALGAADHEAEGDGEGLARSKSESFVDDAGLFEQLEDALPQRPLTYDAAAEALLRGALWQCEHEACLEGVLAFAVSLLETLYTVNDQVERRTLGRENLRGCIARWERLVRQVRLVLFVRSRSVDTQSYSYGPSSASASANASSAAPQPQPQPTLTLRSLQSGQLSIFRVLAADSLLFALRAEQAREHELQCLEVYRRRLDKERDRDRDKGLAAGKEDVLLAWGAVADKRWRDLISIAVNEDSSSSSSSSSSNGSSDKKRRRKPLLLYFPHHNDVDVLGSHRALLLAERYAQRVDKMEALALVCEHLFDLSPAHRPVVALHVCLAHMLPIVQALVDLEEDRLDSAHLNASADRKKQLLAVMAEVALLNSFIRCVGELLHFVMEGLGSSSGELDKQVATTLKLLEKMYLGDEGAAPPDE
eukprot:gene42484-51901_t